ncbi:MAG: NlpC/P60 family protein [Bacteroidota bacterium]
MKYLLIVIISALIIVGCSEQPVTEKTFDRIAVLQKKYAPDKRTAVFTIRTYERGNELVVAGDVERQEAKDEILKLLTEQDKNVVDSIMVLPDERLGEKKWGIITVSVANMRSDPGEDAELSSQVLMGSVVKILKKKGGWVYIQSADKYLGWADPDQMIRVSESSAKEWINTKRVFVTSFVGSVLQKPEPQSFPVCDITGGAVLKDLGTSGEWTKVGLADGRTGFLPRNSVIDYALWGRTLTPVPDNIERTGKFLLGVPYLWGGTSPKGVDCSGFTRTVFLLNGQQLNRDANQQAEQGEEVEPGSEFQNLRKGDLLFFGRKADGKKPERIVHVGIYLGGRQFIHSSGKVRINSFDPASPIYDEPDLRRFVRARRVIASAPQVAEVKTK